MRSCGEEKRVDRRRGSGERGEERGADGGWGGEERQEDGIEEEEGVRRASKGELKGESR